MQGTPRQSRFTNDSGLIKQDLSGAMHDILRDWVGIWDAPLVLLGDTAAVNDQSIEGGGFRPGHPWCVDGARALQHVRTSETFDLYCFRIDDWIVFLGSSSRSEARGSYSDSEPDLPERVSL